MATLDREETHQYNQAEFQAICGVIGLGCLAFII